MGTSFLHKQSQSQVKKKLKMKTLLVITLFAVAHARTALYEEDAADPRRAPVYQAVAPLVEIASDFLAKRDAEESERAFADPRAPLVEIASDLLAKRSVEEFGPIVDALHKAEEYYN